MRNIEGMWAVSTSGEGAERYHHGDLRNALLAAAARLLRAGGAEAVSLREAAREAGVSHNAPYRHFPSRDALLGALARDGFRALRAEMEAVRETGGARLAALGRVYLRFAARDRALFLLMFGRPAPAGEEAEARAAFAVLDAAVTGKAAGSGPVALATIRAWGLVHGLAHLVADGLLAPETAAEALAAPTRDD